MSAILSADDLNDFISPGVACIKPIETIPANQDDSSVCGCSIVKKITHTNCQRIPTKSRLKTKSPPEIHLLLKSL